MDKNEIRQIGAGVLEALSAAGAEQAECHVHARTLYELNIDAGEISLMRTTMQNSISMKSLRGGRKGSVVINKTSREAIENAAREARALMDSAEADQAEGIADVAADREFSSGSREPDRDMLYSRMTELQENVKERYPKVSLMQVVGEFRNTDSFYCNTNGVRLLGSTGYYSTDVGFGAQEDGETSSMNYSGAQRWTLDRPIIETAMLDRLRGEAERQIKTVPLEGKYTGTVLLTPTIVPILVSSFMGEFLTDLPLMQGTSMLKDKIGERVASPLLTISCNPLDPRNVGVSPFTADGYEARDMDIISAGVLKSFVLSRYGAKKTGLERSANLADCLEVKAGDTPLEDMIASVERGILVNRFSGGRPSSNGDFTGVAKNAFLIENGTIGPALSETMMSGNMLALFGDIIAVSRESVDFGCIRLPFISCSGVTISGK